MLFRGEHGAVIRDFGVTDKIPVFRECLLRVPLVLLDPTEVAPPRRNIQAASGGRVRPPQHPMPSLRIKAALAPTSFGPGTMLRTNAWTLCLSAKDQDEPFACAPPRRKQPISLAGC